jgi:hypothetical protein
LRHSFGWSGNSLYIVSVNGQEFKSFRRKTISKASHEFGLLHRQEKFIYICESIKTPPRPPFSTDTLHGFALQLICS